MSNQVEVEVVLEGAEEAKKGLDGIGETAGKMAEKFTSENEKLGEGLGSLTGDVTELVGSVKDLGSSMTTMGSAGKTAWLGLIGPLGAVAAAGFALYETFLNISGAAQEAEDRAEAMSAAAGDLQSKLEALAEKGVMPNVQALREFTIESINAQVAKELLQKRFEKLTKSYEKILKAQDELTDATKAYNGEAGKFATLQQAVGLTDSLTDARENLTNATNAYNKEIEKLLPQQQAVNDLVSKSADKYKAFEDSSAEATLARVKENIALLNTLQLRDAEINLTDKALKQKQIEINTDKELLLLQAEKNKEDATALAAIEAKLKGSISEIDQEKQLTAFKLAQIKKLNDENKKATKSNVKRVDTSRIKELAIERQKQSDLAKLRQLELQQMRLDGASALKIANERLLDSLKAAQGNNEKLKIAHKEYQLELTRIDNEASAQRQANEQARIEQEKQQRIHASQLAYDSLEFDINLRKDSLSKELSLLELKYARERELNASTQEEITELNRRESIERARITNKNLDTQIAKIGELSSQYGAGFAEAAYSALLFGDSFKEATGDILVALGRQAAIKALMETAEGTAALFLPGGQAVAAGHFKAAGLFAGAAAAAGIAGKALGGGSSGGGGGADSTPTGAPTTTTTTQREQAEQAPMVFNINFGGAVIYDTQRAAEQALADRITTLQNVNRRGAPRRR